MIITKWLKINLVSIVLGLILLLAAFLRFYNLEITPGWWPDEGVMLNIAGNLARGKMQLLATSYSFVPHPPLYFLINLPFLLLFGQKLIVLRAVSAVIGLLSVYFIFLCGKALKNNTVGLIAAFLFAFYPLVLINSRLALSYHLLTLLFILTLYFSIKYTNDQKEPNLYLASFFAGLAVITSFFGIAAVIFALIFTLCNRYKLIFKAILISFLPLTIYLSLMLLIDKNSFLHDINYIFNRPEYSSNNWLTIFNNYKKIFSQNYLLILGLLGIFLLPKKNNLFHSRDIFYYRKIYPKQGKFFRNNKFWVFFFFVLISWLEFRMRGFWWYLSTYLFILILGLATAIEYGTSWVYKLPWSDFLKKVSTLLVIIGLLALLSGKVFISNIEKIYWGQWFGLTEEKQFSPESQSDLEEVIDYINSKVNKDDTVLSSAHLSWLIQAKPTDPILSYIYQDKATSNFPDDMRKTGRFVYDPSYQKAKFLLEDKFMKNWFPGQPGIKEGVLNDIYDHWPLVYEKGEFKVYKNPEPGI